MVRCPRQTRVNQNSLDLLLSVNCFSAFRQYTLRYYYLRRVRWLSASGWIVPTPSKNSTNCSMEGRRSNPSFPNDADILAHIAWLLCRLQVWDLKVEWVKAHQDKNLDCDELPLNARINILADELATSYQSTAKAPGKQPRAQASFLVAKVSYFTGKWRTGWFSQYDESIRFHVNGTILHNFLQDTRKWDDSTWNTIGMESIGAAFQKLDAAQRVGVSKMMYGWNNTGTQQKKITQDALSTCTQDQRRQHGTKLWLN